MVPDLGERRRGHQGSCYCRAALGTREARSLREHPTVGRSGFRALDDEDEALTCILALDLRIRYADTRMALQCNGMHRDSCAYTISLFRETARP